MKILKYALGVILLGLNADITVAQFVVVPAGQNPLAKGKPQTKNNIRKTLPFIDDFSNYEGNPADSLWETAGGVFVNANYGVFPPTNGVATFDAIDNQGILYANASITIFDADTLTSLRIRLDSVFLPNARKLSIADSVYLSFYVQPGGGYGQMWQRLGVTPSKNDTLLLEFYNSNSDTWDWIWSMNGLPLDSLYAKDSTFFRYILIPVKDAKYFNDGFRFRFRNFATLEETTQLAFRGNCDQWNVDYVYLNYNRTIADSTRNDLAFVSKAGSLLKHYQAMPSRQYRAGETVDSLNIVITNLDSVESGSSYRYWIFDDNNNQVAYYDGGFENISPFIETHQYQTYFPHARPPVSNSVFDALDTSQWASYTIIHNIRSGVGQDSRAINDTVKFLQRFENFYAYDDGSAEQGIGLEANPNSHFAVSCSLNCPDTLTAIDIYFNSTYHNASQKPFYLCIWNSLNGMPSEVIYRSEQLTPHTAGLNQFNRYVLNHSLIVEGKIFISLQSKTGAFLNIGFDQNNDASANTYAYVNNQWYQSFVKGSPMIRPYFGVSALVGLNGTAENEERINIYPNPADRYINIYGMEGGNYLLELYNIAGKKIYEQAKGNSINAENFTDGIYLLYIKAKDRNPIIKKIIVKH